MPVNVDGLNHGDTFHENDPLFLMLNVDIADVHHEYAPGLFISARLILNTMSRTVVSNAVPRQINRAHVQVMDSSGELSGEKPLKYMQLTGYEVPYDVIFDVSGFPSSTSPHVPTHVD